MTKTWEYRFGIYRRGLLTKIQDNLYIGDSEVAQNKKLLNACGIVNVISLGNETELTKIYRYFEDKNYLQVQVEDAYDADISSYFSHCNDFIQQSLDKGEGILVHCYAGISRSATIIISYLMKQGMSYLSASQKLKIKRPFVNPNINFVNQLCKFYQN